VAKPNASAGTSAPTTVQSIDTSKNPKQVSTPPAPAAATSKSMPPVPTTQQSNTDYKGTKGAQSLMALNPDKIQNVNQIRAGDTINLGGDKSYTIKQGDTLDRIAANQLSSPTNVATPPAQPSNQTLADKDPTQNNTNSSTQADESLNRMKSLAGIK
jgi:hypothetical protein